MDDSHARVGFVFSTKDRTGLSERSLASVDLDGGFDLIWVDGSKTPEGKAFPYSVKLSNANLAEVHSGVTGGPDAAIKYGLNRLLELGYDYCGLIENDIEFKPGWFAKLMELFRLGEDDGLRVGAATARSIGSRILSNRSRYGLVWNAGAGMLLLTRNAAKYILYEYRNPRASEIARFYKEQFGIDVSGIYELFGGLKDRVQGCDWWFAPQLYKNGLASLSTVPSMATNIDIDLEAHLRTNYVRSDLRISEEDNHRFATIRDVLTTNASMPAELQGEDSLTDNADNSEYRELLEKSELELQRGNAQLAKKHLEYLLTRIPGDVAALNDLSVANILLKDWMPAAKAIGRVLEIEPENPIAIGNLQVLKRILVEELDSMKSPSKCWCGGSLVDSVNPSYFQCKNCGTFVSKQQPTDKALKDFYTFDGYWHDYVSKLNYPTIEERESILLGERSPVWLKTIKQYKKNIDTLLEIGCSEGSFLYYCKQNGINNAVGVEVDQATCDYAKKHFRIDNVVAGIFPNVSLPFKKYDVIAGFDVLEHFTDPVGALAAVREYLEDDGICIFQTPCYKDDGAPWMQFKPKEHLFLFNDESARLLFDRAGLEVIDVLPGFIRQDVNLIARKKVRVEYNIEAGRPEKAGSLKKKTIGVGLVEHMGDIVACEPVARYLRATYPDSRIVWCVRQEYRELIDTNPFVDETCAVTCLTEWIMLVDNGVFDKVVDLHVNRRVCPACNIELNKHNENDDLDFGNYYKKGNLLSAFSKGAGLPALEGEPRVYVPDSIAERINRMNLPERFIVAHCKSNETVRDWNESHWISLAREIASRWGLPIIEVGSSAVLAGRFPNVMNYCGKLSILETAEVIRRASLFIGIDSGPAHLANAVGTFGIILLGDYANFQHYLPYSGKYADGSNADLIYSDVGPASNIPVARVIESIERNIERGTAQATRHLGETSARRVPASGDPAAKLIAFYLPQFHPIQENDEWWGKGFTEWRNVATAKPLLAEHYQPHLPADLGFYDLRVPEVREEQARLAKEHGISGFCYWHYWFNGKLLLDRPFNEVLEIGKPDFPFCLAWANENWTRNWNGQNNSVLQQQTYGGVEDAASHFAWLLRAFRDPRYMRIDGKPVFLFYRPENIPGMSELTSLWRKLALDNGLPGLYLIAIRTTLGNDGKGIDLLYDGELLFQPQFNSIILSLNGSSRLADDGSSRVYEYDKAVELMARLSGRFISENENNFACVFPSWDNTARRKGLPAFILNGSTPTSYEKWLRKEVDRVANRDEDKRIVFINAWNEWAEGNHLEPDLKFGHQYLDATARAVKMRNRSDSESPQSAKSVQAETRKTDLGTMIELARKDFAQGRVDEAEQKYKDALAETSRLFATDFHMSKLAVHRGEKEKSDQIMQHLKFVTSLNAQIHNDLGVLYFNLGQQARAKSHLFLSISADGRNEIARKNLADLLLQTGELNEDEELHRALVSANQLDAMSLERLSYMTQDLRTAAEDKCFNSGQRYSREAKRSPGRDPGIRHTRPDAVD